MYLTYERYAALGGKLPADGFEPLSVKAEALLDEWTSGRIDKERKDEIIELALCMIVDEMADGGGREVTSFSNGVDSFGFASSGAGVYGDLYDRVTAILSDYLVSLVV